MVFQILITFKIKRKLNYKSMFRNYKLPLLSIIMAFLAPLFIYAQDSAEQVTEVESKSLIDMYVTGGWAMYPLTLMSMAMVGFIIYNFLAIRPKQFLRPDLQEQVKDSLKRLDVPSAIEVCSQNNCAVTNIVGAGLNRVTDELDPESIEKAMEETSGQEMAAPFVLINYLNVIATLAPMVGLLGTVSGMVKAFNVIAAQGTGDPKLLAGNISEALITTASGMIVGIPAMFFYFFFKNKYGAIVAKVSQQVGDILFIFVNSVRTGGEAYAEGEDEAAQDLEEEYVEEETEE
jgi:biopolymer transport protein ExbB